MSAVDALRRGRESFAQQAWGQAYEDLQAADADGGLDAEDLRCLGIAAYLTGRDEDGDAALERAHQAFLERGEVPAAVRSAFVLGRALLQRGLHAQGGGWLARAQRLLDGYPQDCVERGYLLVPVGLRTLEGGDPAGAYAAFDRAAKVADRFDDPDLTALGLLGRGRALIRMGEAAEGTALLDEAMVWATGDGISPLVAGIVYCAVILTCQEIFDMHRAREWTVALNEWCSSQQDLVPFRGQCLVHRSEIMQLRGDWRAAMEEVRQARDHLSQRPGDPVQGMAFYQQGELHRLRGDFADAEQAYRRASEFGRDPQPGLALLRLAQGRTEAAEGAIRRAVEETDSRVQRARMLAASVEILLTAGDVESARAAADELSETAETVDAPYLRAVAAHADGAVLLDHGDPSGAREALRRAWRTWRELEAVYEAACSRMLMGVACQQLGDEETAAMELDSARRTYEELGAKPALARLDAMGGPGQGELPEGLTAREVEVLGQVAAGKTNRDIAAELVISEHTVARHLQNIFLKLDVTSRTAAAAFAHEHDLV